MKLCWWTACVLAGVAYCQAPQLPTFEQFVVAGTFMGRPAPPVFRTAAQRQFRTRIREDAADGPNFAGHYTIAQWGCGAGCVSMAVIDAKDGKVYDGPFSVFGWDKYMYEGKYSSNTAEFEPLAFHTDSRLLIARGCPEEKNCASYFYEWTANSFKLLRKIPGVKLPQ